MTNIESGSGAHWLGNPRILFALLLLQIVLQPLSLYRAVPVNILLHSLTIAGAVYVVCIVPRDRNIAIGLGIPALMAVWVAWSTAFESFTLVALALVVSLYLFIVARMLTRIARAELVDGNTIFLAASCFLLIGTIWTLFYHAIISLDPSAISGVVVPKTGTLSPDLFYFSFVTLTTLGYGDISPVTPIARSVAVLESVVGTLFVAIVIAILIGKYSARGTAQD